MTFDGGSAQTEDIAQMRSTEERNPIFADALVSTRETNGVEHRRICAIRLHGIPIAARTAARASTTVRARHHTLSEIIGRQQEVPRSMKIHVHENAPGEIHVVIPLDPRDVGLDERTRIHEIEKTFGVELNPYS